MFPVTITLHNPEQLAAVMAAMSADTALAAVATPTAKPEATTEKKPKAQASTSAKTPEAPASTQPTAEAAGAAAPESKAGNSDAAQSGSEVEGAWNTRDGYKDSAEYQAVAKAVVDVARAKGREAAATLLEQVAGVKSLPEAKPSQAQAIIDAFKAGV